MVASLFNTRSIECINKKAVSTLLVPGFHSLTLLRKIVTVTLSLTLTLLTVTEIVKRQKPIRL